MLGYTAAQPASDSVGKKFALVLATYDETGWRAAGYYEGATFLPAPARPGVAAVQEMAIDVFELARQGGAAPRFMNKTLSQIEDIIESDFSYFRWSIPKGKVFVFQQPVVIPTKTFNPGRQRMSTSFNLSNQQFDAIIRLGPSVTRQDDGLAEEEGTRMLKRKRQAGAV